MSEVIGTVNVIPAPADQLMAAIQGAICTTQDGFVLVLFFAFVLGAIMIQKFRR